MGMRYHWGYLICLIERTNIYKKYIFPIMDELLKRYAGMCDAGEIKMGKELPRQFTYRELEYLFNQGYIIVDGNTFLAMITDGFGQ